MAAVAVVLAVAGCRKHERYQRQSGGSDSGSTVVEPVAQFELSRNDSWKIEYGGRQTRPDGKVEVFTTRVPNNVIYLISVLSLDDYASYNNDKKQFMENELKWVMGMDSEQQKKYIYTGPETIYLDPLRSGDWLAFIIAIDSDNNLTGEYSYLSFSIEQEEPTPEYKKWIGTWKVTGKLDGSSSEEVSYILSVDSEENNYMYRVYGWETLENKNESWKQKDEEDLVTFFDSGDMIFTSQYIRTYEDKEYNDTVEEVFLGEIFYKGAADTPGLYIIEEEDIDLAKASFKDEKQATIEPVEVRTVIGEGKEAENVETVYYDMKYFGWSQKEMGWFVYNEHVGIFPYAMEKLSDEPAPKTKSLVQFRGAKTRVQRGRVHVSRSERKPAKAVFAGNR